MSAFLRIDRLLVTRGVHILYDGLFHAGLNIIHGSNGSGKSTIADFIFFGLGGDLKDWRESAERAEAVTLQVTTASGALTLRRHPSTDGMRPMSIFFGRLGDALASPKEKWQTLPYKRQDSGYSFSQILFRAIGLPEAVSDGASNITMHQVLRMLYVDQLTPVQRIFRAESFDTWQTRLAIGDMLAGIGGYELFDRQIELRDTKKKLDEAKREYSSLVAVAAGYGENILSEYIQSDINSRMTERQNLLGRLEQLTQEFEIDSEAELAKQTQLSAIRTFNRIRKEVANLENDVEVLFNEISDAELFIAHLQGSIYEFESSKEMFLSLGRLDFEFCPACFSPVEEKAIAHCQLCDTPRVKEGDDARVLAVKLDLQMQARESESLQLDRRQEYGQKKAELRSARTALRHAAAAADLTRTGTITGREALVADLSRKVGFIDSQLEVLQRRLELAARVAEAGRKKEDLNAKVLTLEKQISALERSQGIRKSQAYTLISSETQALLEADLQEHSDFGKIEHVGFSFEDDWVAINGEKNRSRSASGMVVLKNSFAAGMLKSALVDKKFNLPRWMLFDNIEDKGMVPARSHNFQRLLVDISANNQSPHQIIFTTSMLAPELEGSDYIIGPKYSKDRKTLAQ